MKIQLTYPVKIYKVPSRSHPEYPHRVYLYSDGSFECDCPSGIFKRKTCRHREIVKNYLEKKLLNK